MKNSKSKKHHILPKKILRNFCYDWYDLCLMSELPQNRKPTDRKLYLEKYEDKLRYVVLSPKNEKGEGKLDILVEGPLTQKFLDSKKSEILDITSKRRHTKLFFLFFPKEWGHIRNLERTKEQIFKKKNEEEIFFRRYLMTFINEGKSVILE